MENLDFYTDDIDVLAAECDDDMIDAFVLAVIKNAVAAAWEPSWGTSLVEAVEIAITQDAEALEGCIRAAKERTLN